MNALERGGTKLKVLAGILVLLLVAIGGAMAYGAMNEVRQMRPASSLTANGKTERTRDAHALDYSVAIPIGATPDTVWKVLTDASSYPSWNSTIVRLGGIIAPGSVLELVSKDAPDRVFKLKVSTFEAPAKMVWEDGNPMFRGVRTFTLTPGAGGTTVLAMSETFSGTMLPMIEGSLPNFTGTFDTFAADLKRHAEATGTAAAR